MSSKKNEEYMVMVEKKEVKPNEVNISNRISMMRTLYNHSDIIDTTLLLKGDNLL